MAVLLANPYGADSYITLAKEQAVPTATRWLHQAADPLGRNAIGAVAMVVCPSARRKGTGFFVSDVLVTNEHVIRGCRAADLYAVSSDGRSVSFSSMRFDADLDLAALVPSQPPQVQLKLAATSAMELGGLLRTWGYPLGYSEPAPILTVGYLSGFRAVLLSSGTSRRLIVNAAFNSGNSGGPLLSESGEVLGVVVAKHLPDFEHNVKEIVDTLSNAKFGVMYQFRDASGAVTEVSEAQLTAQVLVALRDMGQVMLGEAISVEDLRRFLTTK